MPSDEVNSQPLAAALSAARRAVDVHWRARSAQQHEPTEVELTGVLLANLGPHVRYAQFTQREERATGADWLWWFVADNGECFGMMVQAKRIRGQTGHWTLDLGYPEWTRGQLRALMMVADEFEVPPVYLVFFGEPSARQDLRCIAHPENDAACTRCERSSVALLSAFAALTVLNVDDPYQRALIAADSLRYSVPLEDVGDVADQAVWDLNWGALSMELQQFLRLPEAGPRGVAKHIFEVAANIRMAQLGAATLEVRSSVGERVFSELPIDVGHAGVPYWIHTLRGLRTTPPDYVQAFLAHQPDVLPLPGVGGLVVVRM